MVINQMFAGHPVIGVGFHSSAIGTHSARPGPRVQTILTIGGLKLYWQEELYFTGVEQFQAPSEGRRSFFPTLEENSPD